MINYFGPGQVFKDIEALPLGVDFVDFIREKLQRAFVMVVVIGPDWVQDRLQDPHDLHREEIRTALERGLHIVPALVNGATMPKKQDLPEDLQPLVRRNAVEITDTRWDYDSADSWRPWNLLLHSRRAGRGFWSRFRLGTTKVGNGSRTTRHPTKCRPPEKFRFASSLPHLVSFDL